MRQLRSRYLSILPDGSTVIFLPHSVPIRRWHDTHNLVANGFAAKRAVVHPSPQLIAPLKKNRIGFLPFFAQAPRKQLKLEVVHVVLHVESQVKGDEKVFLRVFSLGKLSAYEIDEHHRESVSARGILNSRVVGDMGQI